MKRVLATIICVLAAMVLWLVLEATRSSAPSGGVSASPGSTTSAEMTPAENARLAKIESAVTELQMELAHLEQRVNAGASESRLVASPSGEAQNANSGRETNVPRDHDARWYLDRYVASFANGGTGSEYFRLAVEAYAVELLVDIGGLVRDPRRPAELRRRLVMMLGDGRFAGDRTAIDTLLAAVSDPDDAALAITALGALSKIGDSATARALESLVWSLAAGDLREKALGVIVSLSGAQGNIAAARLFASAPTDRDRAFVLTLLSPTDPASALDVLRIASTLEHDVRLAGAHAIGKLRTEEAIAFIDQWAVVERAPDVAAALGAARTAAMAIRSWDAMQATGAPNADAQRDDQRAWACARPDMGMQWIELGYRPPLHASLVRIFEVNVPGAVAQVIAFDASGGEHELWSGADPTSLPGVFELAIAPTSYAVARLRLVLDTSRRPDWSEIDAVEIIGPDGRAWAASAIASSSFGQ